MSRKYLWMLTDPDQDSVLRIALNKGVARLFDDTRPEIQPRPCLNGIDGLLVLREILHNPATANTNFTLDHHLIVDVMGSDVWTNVMFFVSLERPDEKEFDTRPSHVKLSPQQTSCIVQGLSLDLQKVVLERVQRWFLEDLAPNIKKGLETIAEQFTHGDPLLASDRDNRIFDIHGGRCTLDIPYTEVGIVGENLFWALPPLGHTYTAADRIITTKDAQRKENVQGMLSLIQFLNIHP